MKRIGIRIAILAIVASAVPSWAGGADGAGVRNCTWCHGASGHRAIWSRRDWPDSGRNISRASFGVSASTRETIHFRDNTCGAQWRRWIRDAARDLAIYFATITPKAANDGDSDLAARGRTIYMEGIPEANIVSCYACHGPDAEGVRDIPRLGGLAYFYLKSRLEQWGQGYHSGAGSPMPMVASHLGPNEIEALASYLSFVK